MKEYNLVLFCMMCLFLHNVLFSLENIRERIVFLLFHATFFTFILARPFIGAVRGEKWWVIQGIADVKFAIVAIILSLLFIFLGAFWGDKVILHKCFAEMETGIMSKSEFRKILQNISMVLFFGTYGFAVIKEIEKLTFMIGKDYLEYYTSFQSQLPGAFHTVASFMEYALCIFLATLPSKRKSLVPLILFWMVGIPDLIIGIRNPIMLNSLFVLVYYCYRNGDIGREEVWLGRLEKVGLSISVPFALAFMSAMTKVRSGGNLVFTNIIQMIGNFFYGQGVTFEVLMMGYRTIPKLPNTGTYTFGGIIDYIMYGSIGQILWGNNPLPPGNNVLVATEGHSFAHNMSYLSLQTDYLKGKGWGSSYLLEVYADFGYLGLSIFSFALGVILACMFGLMRKNFWMRIFALVSLLSIFFMPRAEATGWLTFIFTIQFWVCVIFCFMLSRLLVKYYCMRKENKNV